MQRVNAPDGLTDTLFAPLDHENCVGLAVSGGADSLALMVLIQSWAQARLKAPRIMVYSVDHGLRPEARSEADYVMAEAQRRGFEARVLRWEGNKPTSGVQAAARSARYRLMGAAMACDGASVLVTAHHLQDQAETVMMRLAHGSGFEGLGGMAPWSEIEGVKVFRPLLGVSREHLCGLTDAAGLVAVRDPSNEDTHYERVRWRQVMPALARLGLDSAGVAVLARRSREADDAITAWAAQVERELVMIDGFGAACLDVRAFLALPRAVGAKVLARVMGLVDGGKRSHALAQVERLYDAVLQEMPFSGGTALGCVVRGRGKKLWVSREAGRRPMPELTLAPHGQALWDDRFVISNRSGGTLAVRPARGWSRQRAEDFIGQKLGVPAEAIRVAPEVTDERGTVLALGSYGFHEEVFIVHTNGTVTPSALKSIQN